MILLDLPPGTTLEVLLEADEVCVLPTTHALATKPVLAPQDFAGQPFISLARDDPYRLQIDAVFAAAGVERRAGDSEEPGADRRRPRRTGPGASAHDLGALATLQPARRLCGVAGGGTDAASGNA